MVCFMLHVCIAGKLRTSLPEYITKQLINKNNKEIAHFEKAASVSDIRFQKNL